MRLRDGTEVADPRLDRLVQFDERSRNYPIRASTVVGPKPRSYSWRCYQTLNQKNEGACVGFAWAHELLARPMEHAGLDNEFARRVYHNAQRDDQWEGGSYPGASPVYEGTSVIAGAKVCQRMAAFKQFRWSFSLEELILGIGYSPAVLGVAWDDSMYRPDSKGYIRPNGDQVGGHAILCRSVSLKLKRFILRNSWGVGWGLGGDCYITFDDMGALLDRQGEACFAVGRTGVDQLAA